MCTLVVSHKEEIMPSDTIVVSHKDEIMPSVPSARPHDVRKNISVSTYRKA